MVEPEYSKNDVLEVETEYGGVKEIEILKIKNIDEKNNEIEYLIKWVDDDVIHNFSEEAINRMKK